MTLGEKSEQDPSSFPRAMASRAADSASAPALSGTAIDSGDCAFSEVVDKACEGLMEKQAKFSIRRIHKMKKRLLDLENELDDFLEMRNKQ